MSKGHQADEYPQRDGPAVSLTADTDPAVERMSQALLHPRRLS
jgi:hypothetical protein